MLFPLGLIAPWLQDQPLIIKFWAWFEILARSLDLVFLLRKAPMHMFAGCQACFGPIETKRAPIAMYRCQIQCDKSSLWMILQYNCQPHLLS